MSKSQKGPANRREKPKNPETENLLVAEREFGRGIQDFTFISVDSPVEIFKKSFKLEKVATKFDSPNEAKNVQVLVMAEVLALATENTDIEPHIKNILKLFNREDVKQLLAAISNKSKEAKRLSEIFAFTQPREALYLQKVGKVLKKVILRTSFLTAEAFGQISKKSKKMVMLKPNMFKDQEAKIEQKSEVLEAIKAYDKSKKGMKALEWPDKKKIRGFDLRVTFSDQANRHRAIYCSDDAEAKMLRDNAIVRRTLDRDANIRSKVNTLKTIWKVKRAENFYKRHLQKLFTDNQINEKIYLFNETFRKKLKEYLRQHLPNLYDSNYKPQDLYNFEDNSHLVFKVLPPKNEEADLDIIRRQLATIINPEMYIRPDSAQLNDKKNRIHLNSPFEDLPHPIGFNYALYTDLLQSSLHEKRVFQINQHEKELFLEYVVANSKMLLRLNKIVLSNFFHQKSCSFQYTEIDNLIFEVAMFIEQGNYSSTSLSFVSEVDVNYITFDVQNSIKTDLNSLRNLHIKIKDRISGALYFDGVIDIRGLLDSVFLEIPLVHEFTFPYKGLETQAALFFTVAFVPRNLEVAHITLNKELIEAHFDKFEKYVKSSENFFDYRKNFFGTLQQSSSQSSSLDFFHFYNNFLEYNNYPLVRQENLFANSFRESLYFQFVNLLQDVAQRDTNFNEILQNNSAKLLNNDKLGLNPYYDLISRVSGLLTSKERIVLNKMVYVFSMQPYINFKSNRSAYGFQKIMIDQINRGLARYFAVHPSIRADQKVLIRKLTFEIYCLFENNEFDGQNYRIDFSTCHIPIIANIVQLNSFHCSDSDLLFLSVIQILSGNYMRKHSDTNHLLYLDSLVLYFKLIFKNQYSDFYVMLEQFAIDTDTLLYSLLMNSFADYFNPISFAIYNDFKMLLQNVFLVHSQNAKFLEVLQTMEISLFGLVDVLFLLTVLISNAPYIKLNATPLNFKAIIESVIIRESHSLRLIFARILELLDFMIDSGLFLQDFTFFKGIVKTRHDPLIASLKNISINVKTLNIDLGLIQKIISDEITNNATFQNRALTLFTKPSNIEELHATSKSKMTEADQEDRPVSEAPNTFIDEDVYFEILEDGELEAFFEPQTSNKNLPKYIATLVYMNNLDYLLVDSIAHNQKLVSDLNNIVELNLEELNKFCMKYFKASESVKMELYTDLSTILKSKKIPLLKLILILICSFSENPTEICQGLEMLAVELTRVYFPNQASLVFNEAVKYIMDELYNLLPVTYFSLYMRNKIDTAEKNLYCNIKVARISFGDDVIDVSEIVTKHFSSCTFINNRPSILFGIHLCNDLNIVFQDLVENSIIDTSITKFEITIEYYNKGIIEYFNIPFRIGFSNGVSTVCRYSKTFYFDNFVSEHNLISVDTFRGLLESSPFFYFTSFTSLKVPFEFIDVPFTFKFKSKEIFLTVDVTFVFDNEARVCSGLLPWKYTVENYNKVGKFEIANLAIQLNYAYFFLPVRQIYELLTLRIIENLVTPDIFKFVKLNNQNSVISTSKNKEINANSCLFELTDYDRAIKRVENMFVVINLNA